MSNKKETRIENVCPYGMTLEQHKRDGRLAMEGDSFYPPQCDCVPPLPMSLGLGGGVSSEQMVNGLKGLVAGFQFEALVEKAAKKVRGS